MKGLDNIDLNQLRVLAALLETRSVTRAAQRLGLSQPSVSRSLGALRTTFADPLLVKTHAGMILTQRAEALHAPLYQWAAATRALLRAKGTGPMPEIVGNIRVASTDFGVMTVLEPVLTRMHHQAPRLHIEVCQLGADSIDQLGRGAVDLAISGFDPQPGRVYESHLFQERHGCLFRQGHPLAAAAADQALSWAELLAWPHVMLTLNEFDIDPLAPHLKAQGLQRRIMARIPYLVTAPLLLQRTDAVLIGPMRWLYQLSGVLTLASRPTPTDLGSFDYWLLWHERSRRDPVMMWFVDALVQAARAPAGLHEAAAPGS